MFPGDTLKDWKIRQKHIKDKLKGIIGSPVAEHIALSPKIIEETQYSEYKKIKVTYFVEKKDKCYAYLLVPNKTQRFFPAMLCLHGTCREGKEYCLGWRTPNRAYAVELARRGYVVLCPDCITFGERILPGSSAGDSTSFYKKYPEWSIWGKMLWDNQRAIDFLETLDFIEPHKMGVIGHSLGGEAALWLSAFDSRVVVTVGSGLDVKASAIYAFLKSYSFVYAPKFTRYFGEYRTPPFETHELMSLIAPRPLLSIMGNSDPLVPHCEYFSIMIHKLSQVYKLFGKENNLTYLLHGDGHNTSPLTRLYAYSWLDLFLKKKEPEGLLGNYFDDKQFNKKSK